MTVTSRTYNELVVADLTVMLALMAGRNVRQTMKIVNDGQAGYPCFHISAAILILILSVANMSLVPIPLLRSPIQRLPLSPSAHSRLPRLRTHRSSYLGTVDPIRVYRLYLFFESLLHAQNLS